MRDTDLRLERLRGPVPAKEHTARTIAALSSNPGCARRAVLDSAGVDKQRVAAHAGFPMPSGQSPFAISRGNAFEALVKADGCADLLRLLREHLHLSIPEASYDDLESVGGNAGREVRYARTRSLFARAAARAGDAGTLFDHPMLRLEVGGRTAYLEPDLIAFQHLGRFYVVEVKSFAVIDGSADGAKVAAAVTQAAVYVLALRALLDELAGEARTRADAMAGGVGAEAVADEVVLVCPENFSNRPTAARVDIRKQLTVLKRQLSRLARIEKLVAELPPELTFDLDLDAAGVPRRSPRDLAQALGQIEARYAPECLAACEMAYFCRREACGDVVTLGRTVRDDLGGVDTVHAVLELAAGTREPAPEQSEAAEVLRLTARLRAEALQGVA